MWVYRATPRLRARGDACEEKGSWQQALRPCSANLNWKSAPSRPMCLSCGWFAVDVHLVPDEAHSVGGANESRHGLVGRWGPSRAGADGVGGRSRARARSPTARGDLASTYGPSLASGDPSFCVMLPACLFCEPRFVSLGEPRSESRSHGGPKPREAALGTSVDSLSFDLAGLCQVWRMQRFRRTYPAGFPPLAEKGQRGALMSTSSPA